MPKAWIKKWYHRGRKSFDLASDFLSQAKNIFYIENWLLNNHCPFIYDNRHSWIYTDIHLWAHTEPPLHYYCFMLGIKPPPPKKRKRAYNTEKGKKNSIALSVHISEKARYDIWGWHTFLSSWIIPKQKEKLLKINIGEKKATWSCSLLPSVF